MLQIDKCLKILKILQDPETWTDDQQFMDKAGNVYHIDDLLNKEGKVLINRASTIEPLNDSLFLIQANGKASIYNVNSSQYSLTNNFTDFVCCCV